MTKFTSLTDVLDALLEQGWDGACIVPAEAQVLHGGDTLNGSTAHAVAVTIRSASRHGALLWTDDRIVSTLRNRPLTLLRAHE